MRLVSGTQPVVFIIARAPNHPCLDCRVRSSEAQRAQDLKRLWILFLDSPNCVKLPTCDLQRVLLLLLPPPSSPSWAGPASERQKQLRMTAAGRGVLEQGLWQ